MTSQSSSDTDLTRRQFAEWALVAAILTCGALISAYFAWSEQRLTEAAEATRMADQARVAGEQLKHQLAVINIALDSVRATLPKTMRPCIGSCTNPALQLVRNALPGVRALVAADGNGKLLATDGSVEAWRLAESALSVRLAGMGNSDSLYLMRPSQTNLARHDAAVIRPLTDGGRLIALLQTEFFRMPMHSTLYAPDMECTIVAGSGKLLAVVPQARAERGTANIDEGNASISPIGHSRGRPGKRIKVQQTMGIIDAGDGRPLVFGVSRDLDIALNSSRHLAYVYGAAWLVLAIASITVLVTRQRRRETLHRSNMRQMEVRASDAERLNLALEAGGLGLWEWDAARDRMRVDAHCAAMLGMTVDEASHAAREIHWFDDVHPDDRQFVRQRLARHLYSDHAYFEAEFRQRHVSGAWIWILSRGTIVERDANGHAIRILGTRQEIGARKQTEAEIEHLAFYDSLTNLPNRRLLHDRVAQAMVKGERQRRAGAILFVDLDNFKSLNDTLGHDNGDRLLQQVASRLRAVIREGDTVARQGGDEFVILLEDLDDCVSQAKAYASMVAEKILDALCSSYRFECQEVHMTPSIGITMFGDQERSIDKLLRQADLAMYDAKAAGRNTFRFFAPIMQQTLEEQARIENDLRHAIRRNQLMLHFQPIVNAAGVITCAEALVRWKHPERGLVNPCQFIPVAEKSGLILPIGQWVLEEACNQLAEWMRGAHSHSIKVAVNVSARQFRQDDFVDQVLRAIQNSGADPRYLKLELTESIVLDDVEDVIGKMMTLKAHGVSFALDDFGTGYSSLSYLQRLPLDEIKIDKAFVNDMLTTKNAATIVGAIVNLAGSLGMDVVAEGVESEQQHQFLSDCGCRYYQGFLIGRPLPADSMSFPGRHVKLGITEAI